MQNRFRVAHARACVYWHQLKLQSVAGMQVAESIDMPAFMCDYFFNKYGMKRLVQVKLHELISSIKRYYHKDKRVRTCAAGLGVVSPAHTATTRCTTRWGLQVKFFARVCGLFEPVPTESFNFYLQAISILMLDILGVRSVATLAACMRQPTYKHGVSRRRARSANGSGLLLPTEAHGCQFEWRLQHASGTWPKPRCVGLVLDVQLCARAMQSLRWAGRGVHWGSCEFCGRVGGCGGRWDAATGCGTGREQACFAGQCPGRSARCSSVSLLVCPVARSHFGNA